MRLTIRVTPGAGRDAVGGRYGDDDPPVLVVRVGARAVEGRATAAALAAIAAAFAVPRREVRLVSGATSRTKVVEIGGDDAALREALLRLLG